MERRRKVDMERMRRVAGNKERRQGEEVDGGGR